MLLTLIFCSLYINSIAPQGIIQGSLLENLINTSSQSARDLIVTFPQKFTVSLQEKIASQLYERLCFYSQMNRILLIGIDLNEAEPPFIARASNSFLEKLWNAPNVYFLDVTFNLSQSIFSHLNWKDKEKRYFKHHKKSFGFVSENSDYLKVKSIIEDVRPDKVIIWGFDIDVCVYESIRSWFQLFPNQHLELILSLSARHNSNYFSFCKSGLRYRLLKYLKEGKLKIFDSDFYENDEKNIVFKNFSSIGSIGVHVKDDEYHIDQSFVTSDCMVWRLKSEDKLSKIPFQESSNSPSLFSYLCCA